MMASQESSTAQLRGEPEPAPEGATDGDNRDTDGKSRKRGPGGTAPGEIMDADIRSVNEIAAQDGIDDRLTQQAAEAARLRENDVTRSKNVISTTDVDEGISMDFDKEAEPIATHGSTGGLFPGVECTTVAMLATRSGRKYINRYGPETCPWFVIADAAYNLPDNKSEDELIESEAYQLVTDPNCRALDFPYRQTQKDKKPKKEDVRGVLYVVSDLSLEIQGNPMVMVKYLDPAVVKQTDKFKDLKSRQKAAKQGLLDKYPSTYLFLEFKKEVHPGSIFRKDRSWELSSKFRALHGSKGQFSTEQAIYQTAYNRAQRFLAWYKARHPEDYTNFENQAENIVAVERTPSKSPPPVTLPQISVKEEPQSPQILTPEAPAVTPDRNIASDPSPATNIAALGEDTELTEDERREQAEMVWRMTAKVPMDKTLTAKERAKFDMFYRLAKTNGVV